MSEPRSTQSLAATNRAADREAWAPPKVVAVTGAAGYVGRLVVEHLARDASSIERVLALDVRERPAAWTNGRIAYERLAVQSPELHERLAAHGVEALVHLASIVAPPPSMSREALYEVDVLGTRNVAEAAARAGVRQLIHASSGAAYGYHPDQPAWLREQDPLRGNDAFAYARHKRLAEAELEAARTRCPEVRQLILRLCTVLGPGLHNQITRLWSGPVVLGVKGSSTPFSLIWDRDVVRLIAHALFHGTTGIYNVAASGTITLREIAALCGRPLVRLPASWIGGALRVLCRIGVSRFRPEQVMFIAHRPVLANDALIEEVGFVPRLTSREVFELWLAHERGQPEPSFMRRVRAAETSGAARSLSAGEQGSKEPTASALSQPETKVYDRALS